MRTSYSNLVARARVADVIVTTGYSALGYRHPDEVAAQIRRLIMRVLNSKSAVGNRELLIASGATRDGGICDITYETIAQLKTQLPPQDRRRIVSVGLVSSTADARGVAVHDLDQLCLVEPLKAGSWKVQFADGRSMMADLPMQSNGIGVLAAFGGGKVTATELTEAIDRGATCLVFHGDVFAPRDDKLAEMKSKLLSKGRMLAEQDDELDESVQAVKFTPGIYRSGRRVNDDPAAIVSLAPPKSLLRPSSWLSWPRTAAPHNRRQNEKLPAARDSR